MAGERKIAPYCSRVISLCEECGEHSRLVCVECKVGVCEAHLVEFGEYKCIHQRNKHADASLRLLSKGGMVESDDVMYFG